jgi:hypothetical protein
VADDTVPPPGWLFKNFHGKGAPSVTCSSMGFYVVNLASTGALSATAEIASINPVASAFGHGSLSATAAQKSIQISAALPGCGSLGARAKPKATAALSGQGPATATEVTNVSVVGDAGGAGSCKSADQKSART